VNMLKTRLFIPVLVTVASLVVVACGGGGGSVAGGGIGGTGITASGAITGFGSVKLNGLEFDTTNATRVVDGVPAADDTAFAVGMVVTVKGTLSDDGVNGTADQIEYDDEVQGPIQGPIVEVDQTKTFSVMGIQVDVSKISTVFGNTDYGSLFVSQLVEISGFYDGAGILHATRIDAKGGNLIEVKGTIKKFIGVDSFDLAIKNGGTYTVVNWRVLSPPLVVGDFVEVKGSLVANQASIITATDVALKDEAFGDVDKASIEGIVTGFTTGGIGNFQVAGQTVDATAASFSPSGLATSLADGMQVEVEGPILNGVLKALQVASRGGDIEIGAMLESVVIDTGGITGSITLQLVPGSLDVQVDSRTILRDDTGAADPLTLAVLIPMNDYLEVEAYRDDVSGNLIATEIQRDDVDDDLLQGPAASCDGVTVSILGFGYVLDDNVTSYQDENEGSIGTAVTFCNQWATGGFLVKIVDKISGGGPDGIADEAELED
jgi:hypothetical protein